MRTRNIASTLNRLGVQAQVQDISDADLSGIAHVFNIWPPDSSVNALHTVRDAGIPCVFSPIFMNLGELYQTGLQIPVALNTTQSQWQLRRSLKRIARSTKNDNLSNPRNPITEPMPGYFDQIREAVACADAVICLSKLEYDLLSQIAVLPAQTRIIHNGVDVQRFRAADPSLFQTKTGLKDYILCVGRIEERKNQALLAYALKGRSIPLVFIGHAPSSEYAQLVNKYSGNNVHFIDHIPNSSDLLPSAFAGARVLAMPSWVEGAPLTALEAGAAGCRLVLSNRSSEREYFGDYATYCDPVDPGSIRDRVLEAYKSPLCETEKRRQQEFMADRYDIVQHVTKTLDVYRDLAPGYLAEQRV